MNRAAKSYLTSGVALAGASVIAVSPMVAAPLGPPGVNTQSAVTVSTAELQLATTVNPITAWAEVVTSAYSNVAALGEEALSDPAPVLRQFILNQIGYGESVVSAGAGAINGLIEYISPDNPFGLGAQLQTAAEELASGNIAGAIETATQAVFLAPLLSAAFPVLESGVLDVPGTMAQNFANVVNAVTDAATVLPIALGALGTVLAPVNAFGDSLQETFDSLGDGDLGAAFNAIINIPAALTGAVLNGYTNLAGTEFPGLFSEDGLVHALVVTLPRAIADAITPEEASSESVTTGPTDTPPAVLASADTEGEQASDADTASESADGDSGAVDAVDASVTEETGDASEASTEQPAADKREVADEAEAVDADDVSGSQDGLAEESDGVEEASASEETDGTGDSSALEESLADEVDASEDGSGGDDTGDKRSSGAEGGDSGNASSDSASSDTDSGSGDSDSRSGSDSDSGSDSGDSD